MCVLAIRVGKATFFESENRRVVLMSNIKQMIGTVDDYDDDDDRLLFV